jgi:hypothetical protein
MNKARPSARSNVLEFRGKIGFQVTEKIEPMKRSGVESLVAIANHCEKPVQEHTIKLIIILTVRREEASTTVAIQVSTFCQDAVENSHKEEPLTDSCTPLNRVCESLNNYVMWIATIAGSQAATWWSQGCFVQSRCVVPSDVRRCAVSRPDIALVFSTKCKNVEETSRIKGQKDRKWGKIEDTHQKRKELRRKLRQHNHTTVAVISKVADFASF